MNDVPLRDAATVVLLRDGVEGIEVWLLTRVTQMVFAAGMSVFPGGRVDADDRLLPVHGDLERLAARFDCPVDVAHALVGAAVRETFEETGVLLTVPPADLAHARADVEEGRTPFEDLLRAHGLSVDADALHPWSRWVTPEGEVRRYDTRFFVGALPEGAEAQDVTSESSAASWLRVDVALAEAEAGQRGLLPPTTATLAALGAHTTVAEVLAAADAQVLEPVRPTLHRDEDGSLSVELPDGSRIPVPRALAP